MFFLPRSTIPRAFSRTFATTSSRSVDMAKLHLIGRLGRDPELRYTKNNKEYIAYTVATKNSGPSPSEDVPPPTTWHHVLAFHPSSIQFLRNLRKGSLVYVEANFELRQPDPNANPETPEGQRQIFLRHENIKVLRQPPKDRDETELED